MKNRTTIETIKTPFCNYDIEVLPGAKSGPATITSNGQPAQISYPDASSAEILRTKQAIYAPSGTGADIEIVSDFGQRTQMRRTHGGVSRPAEIWFASATAAKEYLVLHLIEATRQLPKSLRAIALDTLEAQAA